MWEQAHPQTPLDAIKNLANRLHPQINRRAHTLLRGLTAKGEYCSAGSVDGEWTGGLALSPCPYWNELQFRWRIRVRTRIPRVKGSPYRVRRQRPYPRRSP